MKNNKIVKELFLKALDDLYFMRSLDSVPLSYLVSLFQATVRYVYSILKEEYVINFIIDAMKNGYELVLRSNFYSPHVDLS